MPFQEDMRAPVFAGHTAGVFLKQEIVSAAATPAPRLRRSALRSSVGRCATPGAPRPPAARPQLQCR